MKQELKENTGLPSSLLWILAIIAGISVANLYYNQPLLNLISHDLKVSEFSANLIAMTTQIGYALGLLFIIPLGDLYKRKTIILINFSILVVSLLTIATAPNIYIILLASLLTGICSVMPQIFVPIAAQFSTPETIIRKSKFPQNPKRSVRFSGKGTKRSVQKRKARNTQKAETKVL